MTGRTAGRLAPENGTRAVSSEAAHRFIFSHDARSWTIRGVNGNGPYGYGGSAASCAPNRRPVVLVSPGRCRSPDHGQPGRGPGNVQEHKQVVKGDRIPIAVNSGIYTWHHKNVLFQTNLGWPYTVAQCSRGYPYVYYRQSSNRGSLVRKVARAGLPGSEMQLDIPAFIPRRSPGGFTEETRLGVAVPRVYLFHIWSLLTWPSRPTSAGWEFPSI